MIAPCRSCPWSGKRASRLSGGRPDRLPPSWPGACYALNFFSPAFVDQLKRGRKTATIRLGDKSRKYERGQIVWVTVGYQHSPREKIFTAVIDDVEVKRVRELSPRDIEHDNPEFRRVDETLGFLRQIYGREIDEEETVTVVRFSQVLEPPQRQLRQRRDPVAQLRSGGMCRRLPVPDHLAARDAARARLGGDLRPEGVARVVARGRGRGRARSRRRERRRLALAPDLALEASLRPRVRGEDATVDKPRLIEADASGSSPARAAGGCSSRTA